MRALVFTAALVLAGCKCPSETLGPLKETPPANLADEGLIVDQPAADGPASGAWISVAGWFDPSKVSAVLVTGAPVPEFYGATGHVGVPTVPVLLRTDGRFFAPRVPLQNGETRIIVVPLGKGGPQFEPLVRTLTVTGADEVPATLVVTPLQPEPGKTAQLRAGAANPKVQTWQWDFDGDGTFDLEAAQPDHKWPNAGRYGVTARTRVDGAWVSAWAVVSVGAGPQVDATAAVDAPSRIFVLPRFQLSVPMNENDPDPKPDKGTRYVAAIDGDLVKVFDADLQPIATLNGLSQPTAVATDPQGRIYVADYGNDRVVRFLPSGSVDTSFGQNGSFSGNAKGPVKKPVSLWVGPTEATLFTEDGTVDLICQDRGAISGRDAPLGDWVNVGCTPNPNAEHPGFQRLGLKGVSHVLYRRTEVFSDPLSDDPAGFLHEGRMIRLQSLDTHRMVRDAIDVGLGPTEYEGDVAWIDSQGRLQVSSGGARETYAFPEKLRALEVGADGVIYLASPGKISRLASPRLR